MVKKKSIQFVISKKSITEPITKFGGLPYWIDKPQWPLSLSTNKPMQFICQIKLYNDIFQNIKAQMAYLFMTDDEDGSASTWEVDGGENAIILQPGNTKIPHSNISKGPTLYKMVKKLLKKQLVPESCEYAIELSDDEDPDFISQDQLFKMPDDEANKYKDCLAGNKIGGCPDFLQNDEFPDEGKWNLLIQIDSAKVPFSINFGDSGIGYGFINDQGTDAKFLWQCC